MGPEKTEETKREERETPTTDHQQSEHVFEVFDFLWKEEEEYSNANETTPPSWTRRQDEDDG